jgi:hypothetical protein
VIPEGKLMKRKTQILYKEEDLLVDLTLHKITASLLTEFAEKIGTPTIRAT